MRWRWLRNQSRSKTRIWSAKNALIQTAGVGSRGPRIEGGWQGGRGDGQGKKLEGGEWKYERQWFLFPDVQPPHQNLYGVFSIPSLLSSVTWMVWGVTLTLFHVGISSLLVGIVPRFVICFLNSVFGLNLWLHWWWPSRGNGGHLIPWSAGQFVCGANYIVMYEEVEKKKEEALEVSMTFQTTECSGRESFSYIDYNSGQWGLFWAWF